MFFIVPSSAPETPTTASSAEEQLSTVIADLDSHYRRRVAVACDRCRLKKARCSGRPAPCKKCKRDHVICVLSKDKKLDTTPKPPAYVRMVESQRDLLLQAVHELRQKDTQWDATSDINELLSTLGVHAGGSEVMRASLMEELATPWPRLGDNSPEGSHSAQPNIVPGISDNNGRTSSGDSSLGSKAMQLIYGDQNLHLTSSRDFYAILNNNTETDANSQLDSAMFDNTAYPFQDTTDQLDESTLITDWPPPFTSPDFNFHDPDHLNMDAMQQPQTW